MIFAIIAVIMKRKKKSTHLSEKAKIDLELIIEARQGNQRAFELLLQRYKDSIFYMILNMLGSRADAEDITFEAFAKAFNNIDQYSEKYSFSTWLFRIATNTCIDFIRKKKYNTISIDSKTDQKDNENPISIKTQMPNPEQKFINKQDVYYMRKEVEKLKIKYRQLIELRYFKEYTYEEISKELEIPLGTVKTQLFRAKELLMKNIDKRSGSNEGN